jgi:hypothetical protein
MQNATGRRASLQSDDRNDDYHAVVSDLVSLIAHVQASVRLIESAIAEESSLGDGDEEIAANIVVLDDVTPRYAKANATLHACNAGLGVALHILLDTWSSKRGANQPAECPRRPVRSACRA